VKALKVKEVSGELVTTSDDDPAGFLLRPGHIHDALRQAAGIREHPLARRFEIADEGAAPLPILV